MAPSLLQQDRWGQWVVNTDYNAEMLAAAICKLEGFTYAPSAATYWQRGRSTRRDFLSVPTPRLNPAPLQEFPHAAGQHRPVVGGPVTWEGTAAANALADGSARGARPLFALNIVNFPRDTLPLEILEQVIQGGAAKVVEAGVAILGGHSVDDPEPKYGLVALGTVHPSKVMRNVGARPGDVLVLTKPLGIGVLTTAIKRGLASHSSIARAVEVMSTLNRAASEAMVASGAVLIPVRLFIAVAVALDFQDLPAKFRRLFPVLLILDLLWAVSPFLLIHHINTGLALGLSAPLVYFPFAQRSLVLMYSRGR